MTMKTVCNSNFSDHNIFLLKHSPTYLYCLSIAAFEIQVEYL